MTVDELITELLALPPDHQVYFPDSRDGYAKITKCRVSQRDVSGLDEDLDFLRYEEVVVLEDE